jgi:polyferredoxin
MSSFNLSVLRKLVQLAFFVFLIYGGVVVGYYSADKLSIAFPALTCAYDHQSADYCVLIPLQHQMDHRLGGVIAAGGSLLMGLMPTLITLGLFLLFFVVLNKAFCGWVCPLGTFQEWIHMIGTKLGLRQREGASPDLVRRMRPAKWLILLVLVFIFPLLTGIGYLDHDLGDPFCKICPSRLMSSLFSGTTAEFHVDSSSPYTIVLSVTADFLFGLMIALALTTRQPFCRICPMLALHTVFRKIGLLRLVKNASDRCDKCGICVQACPMDIAEIQTEMEKRDVTFEDCTLCGRCVEFCPEKNVLQLKYATLPVFSADPQYFKRRKKAQKKWEGKRDKQ